MGLYSDNLLKQQQHQKVDKQIIKNKKQKSIKLEARVYFMLSIEAHEFLFFILFFVLLLLLLLLLLKLRYSKARR
jgi:hypothetical protein